MPSLGTSATNAGAVNSESTPTPASVAPLPEKNPQIESFNKAEFDFLREFSQLEDPSRRGEYEKKAKKIMQKLNSPYDILKLLYSNPDVRYTQAVSFANVLSECAKKIDLENKLDINIIQFKETMAQVESCPPLKMLFAFLDCRKADPKYTLPGKEAQEIWNDFASNPHPKQIKMDGFRGRGWIFSLIMGFIPDSGGEYTGIDKAIEFLRDHEFINWEKPPETSAPQNPATQS